MLKKLAVLVVSCGALAGCGMDPQLEQQEIISNLTQAGYPQSDIQIYDGNVYVGNDALVTLEASREMIQAPENGPEQYRTTNLVGSAVTKICINPSGSFNNYANISRGLDLAIENYNQQNLRLFFARGPTTGCTANISIKIGGQTGGSSGFPSNGLPYNSITIGAGTNNYGADVCEHVVTHEIGHTIGFRHSDYYNRAISCGSGGNEGAGTYGAILIPGTPSTATVGGSVMNSCFRSTETGEWTSTDVTALNALY